MYVKANSKNICEELSFPSTFRKLLMWSCVVPLQSSTHPLNLVQKPLHLVRSSYKPSHVV